MPIEGADTFSRRSLDVYKQFFLNHTHLNGSARLFPSEATQLIKLVSLQKKHKISFKKRWMIQWISSFPIRCFPKWMFKTATAAHLAVTILDQFPRNFFQGCPFLRHMPVGCILGAAVSLELPLKLPSFRGPQLGPF